jgi:hypothetical protein
MDREAYLEALTFCYKAEAVGAIIGELSMLLREDPEEKRKLDIFRRIEGSNRILCLRALESEGVEKPTTERHWYEAAVKYGAKLGEGDWKTFLDAFEETVHPELFDRYLLDEAGDEIRHAYDRVDTGLLRHLSAHEHSFVSFLERERAGDSKGSTEEMEAVLHAELSAGLIGPDEPVGW